MARRSQWKAVLKRTQEQEEFFGKHGFQGRGGLGLGEDFTYNRKLPVSPPTAFYLRRYSSLWEALRALRVDRPAPPPDEDPLAWEMASVQKKVISQILRALSEPTAEVVKLSSAPAILARYGGDQKKALESFGRRYDNYVAAERVLLDWVAETARTAGLAENEPLKGDHPDVKVRVAWQLRMWVHPLILAYAQPKRFFRKVAPLVDSNRLFDPKEIGPFDDPFRVGRLGRALHTWGLGAFLNADVRKAFDSAATSPEKLNEVLAEAEGRGPYSEGSPPGKQKGKTKPGRPRKPSAELRPGSLEKRISREGKTKRRKS